MHLPHPIFDTTSRIFYPKYSHLFPNCNTSSYITFYEIFLLTWFNLSFPVWVWDGRFFLY